MKKLFYLITFSLLFITVACEQTLENESLNSSETNIVGDWTVNAYVDNDIIYGPFTISTQLTSADKNIFIKDNGEFWNFQTKVELKGTNNTFSTDASVNELSNIQAMVRVLNGNIINKDSIGFDIQFEDDETAYGATYHITGHRK